jgi:hypothetical protein
VRRKHAIFEFAYRSLMASDITVVEDGIDESGSNSRDRPRWVLAAVGFGLGLALGTLLAGPATPPVSDAVAVDPDPVPALPEPGDVEAAREDMGISSAVPGFPDTFAALGRDSGSGFDHFLWPRRGPLVVRTMTGGNDVSFDVGGVFLAVTERVPDLDGYVLSMGRVGSIRPLVSGVTSYAWHDSDRGKLSYTTEAEGVWSLFTLSNSEPVSSEGAGEGRLVAWGDWGFAIETLEGEVVLLTSNGDLKGTTRGRFIASHASGWLLVRDAGLKLVSAGGGVRRLDTPDGLEVVSNGSFSPDGSRVALAGVGVVVLDLDTMEETILEPRFRAEWVSWSSDSRFVIAPAHTGVLIHDTETGGSDTILEGTRVVAAATIPVAGS